MLSPIDNNTFTWKKSNDGNSSDFSYLYLGREVDNKVNFRQKYMKFWTQCFRCLASSKYETEINAIIFYMFTNYKNSLKCHRAVHVFTRDPYKNTFILLILKPEYNLPQIDINIVCFY